MKSIDDNPIDKIASKKPEDITKEDVDILVDWILGIKAEIDNPCPACECSPCDCGWGN